MIHSPAHPQSYGFTYREPVELIDIFPTLVDLTHTPLQSQEECGYGTLEALVHASVMDDIPSRPGEGYLCPST